MGDRGAAVRCAIEVIRANALSDAELELQLQSIWKSGYQAGRKAEVRASALLEHKVSKGAAILKRMREETPVSAISSSTPSSVRKDK